jgi:hypothetical protein
LDAQGPRADDAGEFDPWLEAHGRTERDVVIAV